MKTSLQTAAERFATDPSDMNGRAVAIAALPLVRSMARRITLPDHPLATYRDLENAGMLGMVQALHSYDAERGTSFASFAYGRIRGALIDFLRTIDTLSRDRRRRVAEASRTAEELQQELGAEPRAAQVAARLGVTVREYDRLRTDAQQRFALSLFAESDHHPVPIDTLPSAEEDCQTVAVERRSLYEYVDALVERLPAREQKIVNLYFHSGWTLREIAGDLQLTEARISQILSKTLKTLRAHMHKQNVAA
ncbi:MAG: sigma-70 family RNA polymerase sigma factor [Bacteroidota bacterium]